VPLRYRWRLKVKKGINMYKKLLKITSAEAHVMRDTIIKLKLKRPDWFDLLSYEELAACYNGAGSDDTPKAIRKILTRLLGFAKEAILIHDAEYQYTDKFCPFDYSFRQRFLDANRRLGENTELLAKQRTPWYSPLRYWRIFVAHDARVVTDAFGFEAWNTVKHE
jgi:hypothetical protein